MGCTAGTVKEHINPHTCHQPMWVVKVTDVLQMRSALKCHQELSGLGMLHEHHPAILTIFVSHQWLGRDHPDRRNSQFRILQKALRKVIDGSLKLELDMTNQFLGHQKILTARDRKRLQDAYVWFDWFSVPQASCETDAVARAKVQRKADLCIKSIPAYVDASQMFVALVPRVVNEKQVQIDYFTWQSRGWCRAEMWCKLLSHHSDFPIIVVSAMDQVEFIQPVQWLHHPVHAGVFSVERDREEVCNFIQLALDYKLEQLSKQKDLKLFRYFAARYETFLGLPSASRNLESFLSYFHFSSQQAAFRERAMGPVACAALSEDTSVLQQLAAAKAPLHTRLPPMSEVDIYHDWSPLHLAAAHATTSMATLRALLELRGDANATNRLGHPLLGICQSAESVELLIEYRAEVNKLSPPTMASPLVLACLRCAPPEVFTKFIELRADVNLVKGGLGLSPLHSLAINSRVNLHTLPVAQLLLEALANPDVPVRSSGVFRGMELLSRGMLRMRKDAPGIVWVFGEGSTTPLGYAAMFGGQDLVDFLLEQHADPLTKNHRGHTPLQLARCSSVMTTISHRTSSCSDRSISFQGSSQGSPGGPESGNGSEGLAGVASPSCWPQMDCSMEVREVNPGLSENFLHFAALADVPKDRKISETIQSI